MKVFQEMVFQLVILRNQYQQGVYFEAQYQEPINLQFDETVCVRDIF